MGALFQDTLADWPSVITQDSGSEWWVTHVEAGSNTSTVTLWVVGGDEKGSLESETVKYGHESYGTRTRKDCADEGQQEL
jgi:hypothetical protein